MRKFIFTMIVCFSCISFSHGQVLISLLLGDKLNSEKLKFGLDGGASFSSLSNIPGADMRNSFFLGFYFDIIFHKPWSLYTGVMVKSSMGAEGLVPYATGDDLLDQLLAESSVERKLSYFNVPILIRHSFQNFIFLEGGMQLGLLRKAEDVFTASTLDDDDLSYTNEIRDQYKRLDFGLSVGAGYKLMQGDGINIGLRYYGGLVDIQKEGGTGIRNRAVYIFANIPIGGVKSNSEE
ncbi:porin family protein [Catalinimonas sp. 4WD22]|uniref:porin family protein n=1 Tax=Catalinimonas locisalis TaxID=3133978 RepID=UPI003100AE08